MPERSGFKFPAISDVDVLWACRALGLEDDAFRGASGNDARCEILRCGDTLDVEACPGSGKTTLLVAKLAILANKWSDPRRGVCVLSHTNVARHEIQKLLGNSSVSRKLLGYPHFVGTIQSFINEFLALPWLRSLGYPIHAVDNARCEEHRRHLLSLGCFSALSGYVRNKEKIAAKPNIVNKWCVASPDFAVLKENGKAEFKNLSGPSARQLCALAETCVKDGYHRFEEMFMWACDLMDKIPEMRDALRQRFPVLFIDEVQDNDELQSRVLHQIFMDGGTPVIRQRFGDSNQAIFRRDEAKAASTDRFPDQRFRRDIQNSHRFGQKIAYFSAPLGVVPQVLTGIGPRTEKIAELPPEKNAVFLFGEDTISYVIPRYADYLCEVFSENERNLGDFRIVAAVHKRGKDDILPRYLGQYWEDYDPQLCSAEPQPDTLYQYVMTGRTLAEQSGEAHYLIEKISESIFRLARISHPTTGIVHRKRRHGQLLEILSEHEEARANYLNFVVRLAPGNPLPNLDEWDNEWVKKVVEIAQAVVGTQLSHSRCQEFLRWNEKSLSEQGESVPKYHDNFFRHPRENPKVTLKAGSIHSVKGETHTSTLILDTYFHDYHLVALKPWLLGKISGGNKQGIQNISRLRQHYVAMTRPTHLLCLAMRKDALSVEEVGILKHRGWRVARVCNEGLDWL